MGGVFDSIVPFVEVARRQSFRAAAERLGVTPAAVSKAVKKLEEDLGVELLHRTTRRVSLSEPGTALLARCQEAIALIQDGRDEAARAQRVPRGTLTVSASPIAGRYLVRRLPAFMQRYPGLEVDLRLTDRLARLVDDRVDVALRLGPLPDSSLIARKVLDTRWVTVASPAYLAQHGTPPDVDALARHVCLGFRSPRGKTVQWSFSDDHGKTHSPGGLAFRLHVDQGPLLVEGALASLGISQVLDYMVVEDVRAGRLVEVLSEHAAQGPAVHALCLPAQKSAPKVRAFIDFLVSRARAGPSGP